MTTQTNVISKTAKEVYWPIEISQMAKWGFVPSLSSSDDFLRIKLFLYLNT